MQMKRQNESQLVVIAMAAAELESLRFRLQNLENQSLVLKSNAENQQY